MGYDLDELEQCRLNQSQIDIIVANNTIHQDVAILQAHPLEDDGVNQVKLLRRNFLKKKEVIYQKWKPPLEYSLRRGTDLDPRVRKFFNAALAAWQEKHKAEIKEGQRPYGGQWYMDLRIKCIAKKIGLDRDYSELVAKSHFEALELKATREAERLKKVSKRDEETPNITSTSGVCC